MQVSLIVRYSPFKIEKMTVMSVACLSHGLAVIRAGWVRTAVSQLRSVHLSSSLDRPKQPSPDELKAHQEALMRRSLPKKRRLPGVKNIVLVSSGKGTGTVPECVEFYIFFLDFNI